MKIKLDHIVESLSALRPVNKESPDYISLVDSVRAHNGVLLPILVRPAYMPDGVTPQLHADGSPMFVLIDGLHRWNAAQDAGLSDIKAEVEAMSDEDVEVAQLEANAIHIKTKPAEYAGQLQRILERKKTMSVTQLAARIRRQPAWVHSMLKLNDLSEEIRKMVDAGKIVATNAFELAKVKDAKDQEKLVEDAQVQTSELFKKTVSDFLSDKRKAKLANRNPDEVGKFKPQPSTRKISELVSEAETADVVGQLLQAVNITDPVEAAKFALRWALHLDEQSVQAAKAKWEAKKEAEKALAKRRAEERAEEKLRELKEARAAAGK